MPSAVVARSGVSGEERAIVQPNVKGHEAVLAGWPADWPADGPIDLSVQDLPHASSATEWWYVNSHFTTADGREVAFFASFFRVVRSHDEVTDDVAHAHSLTWALVDLEQQTYRGESRVDKEADKIGLERMDRGEGTQDQRLRRAMREVLEKGNVPYPDQKFDGEVRVATDRLDLDFGGAIFLKEDDGSYRVRVESEHFELSCEVSFRPQKTPARHGDNGVVRGTEGEQMFYYFIPRCTVTGSIAEGDLVSPIADGQGWYDHEFGGFQSGSPEELRQTEEGSDQEISWNWIAVQLNNGTDITAYSLVDSETQESVGQYVVLSDEQGVQTTVHDFEFTPRGEWTSTRTFNTYPVGWTLNVPALDLRLEAEAAFSDQEFVTLLSKPAFWEGRIDAIGSLAGEPITGKGWVERSGFTVFDELEGFFKAVGKQVRKSVQAIIPFDPSYEQVRDLIASEERDHYMEGVDLDVFTDTCTRPVREIVDRGGKSWRSYAALACCDVVGGDSREFVQWLAMPEFMHVGSLIVDDVQDQSDIRRGGPTCHLIYGEPLAINAGTACYFVGQKLLFSSSMSDQDRLRIYDLYFEALRAGHAGQAFDIRGVDHQMESVVMSGQTEELERSVLATHRLKTAAPAGALARMGAVVGGGSDEQIEALGSYFESVGLAFQIVDDVLNLRGFKGNLKDRGEDIRHGKVTMPVVRAMGVMQLEQRRALWDTIKSKPTDSETVVQCIDSMERCGAVADCVALANELVEAAWQELTPLIEDSLQKLMLRAFGWYILERHY